MVTKEFISPIIQGLIELTESSAASRLRAEYLSASQRNEVMVCQPRGVGARQASVRNVDSSQFTSLSPAVVFDNTKEFRG